MSKNVLVVEDSRALAEIIRAKLTTSLSLEVTLASTYAEALRLLDEAAEPFDMALLDLKLPDAMNGEIIDLMLMHDIPSVVFTTTFSEDLRALILSKNVIDYVLKENLHDLDYVVDLIRRILRNPTVEILVVDDSKSSRHIMKHLLSLQKFTILEAENGDQALEILDANPNIKLVITDYIMPGIDGFELVSRIRRRFDKNKLAVIGISNYHSGTLSAKFLKKGANDFITKPFVAEEFYCRVNQNIDYLEYVASIENMTYQDFLTSVWNRRYFFTEGDRFYSELKRRQAPLMVAMIDLDHFKDVNDSYGHDVGDEVLKRTAGLLRAHFSSEAIVARLGGEEFTILCSLNQECQLQRLEQFRVALSAEVICAGSRSFSVTASIGATSVVCDTLAAMLASADELLYCSKTSGRNKSTYQQPD